MFVVFVISLVLLALLLAGKMFELAAGRKLLWSTRRQRLDAHITRLVDEFVRYQHRFRALLRNQVTDFVVTARRRLAGWFRRLADRLH